MCVLVLLSSATRSTFAYLVCTLRCAALVGSVAAAAVTAAAATVVVFVAFIIFVALLHLCFITQLFAFFCSLFAFIIN